MAEQKVKKREWVKTAAIIFLAVMLLLTFFSNTIMNRSLPEVAAQYVDSGSINAKIRGSGVVTANESFEVKSEQARKVESVPVKTGDKVEVGDPLLYFADAESSEIKTAQDELDKLELDYELALVDAGGGQYAKETRAVEQARAALDKAKADMEKNYVSEEQLDKAKAAVDSAEIAVSKQEDVISQLETKYGTTQTDIDKALSDYQSILLVYETDYNQLVTETNDWMKRNDIITEKDQDAQRDIYMGALVARYKQVLENATLSSAYMSEIKDDTDGGETVKLFASAQIAPRWPTNETMEKLIKAYEAVNPKKVAYETAKNSSVLTEARAKLVELKRAKTNCDDALTDLKAKRTEYETLEDSVYSKRDALDTALNALADAQVADKKADVQLQAQKKQLDAKRKALEDLRAGGSGAMITSEVAGTVKAIDVKVGEPTETGKALITIEVPEKGYGVSFAVPIENSKKVKVGDAGEIINGYWGANITATLTGIKTDPQNPSTKKILRFKLDGDVESGSNVSVSIGERGANYDCIVPSSAIRTDNNGSFVLVVVSKSSPLGNRYVAQRVDVKVEASDDVNSAVSGGLSNRDMVITTSNKPIETGMLVRLPE